MPAAPTFSAQSGEICGTLFENERVGVSRGVYWSCSVEFAVTASAGESSADAAQTACSLLYDWLTWPVRSWRDIDALTLASCAGPIQVEATLYFADEHQPLTSVELTVRRAHADRFRVQGRFVSDLLDARGDRFCGAGAEFDVEVPFTGLSVLPGNLTPKPKSAAQAAAALAQFADLTCYEQPEWADIHWLFRPRLTDTGD